MDNKLGKVISNLRKEMGITQKDLADALNISDKAISRWERGTSRPTLEMMFQISKFFNVSYNDLITARISDNTEDDKIVEDIIKEFSDMGKKNVKRIKFVLLFSVVIILILTAVMVFTNTYNRFKVYKVYSENDTIERIYGTYIETNIRDALFLGDIKVKDIEISKTDIISVDLYILENNEEKIIYNYSSLNDIYLIVCQSYIEIENLSDYFNNLYLRVSITDEKNKTTEYETKLEFVLEFSNNKIYYENDFGTENFDRETIDYSKIDIKKILLDNGFEESSSNTLLMNFDDYKIIYKTDTKILTYNYEKNEFTYKYSYRLNENILEVSVYDDNLTSIQNYNYDIENNKMNCLVGKCNDYQKVLEILDEKVLYLFEK